ncbi:MAG TPA: hypothetical protein VG820_11900 [Fimbriimonadaceae bacterium]|nr:hypothetical protein [Fimbriimonadaceae bacterium]
MKLITLGVALLALATCGCKSEEQANADKMQKALEQQRGSMRDQQAAQKSGKMDVGPGATVRH